MGHRSLRSVPGIQQRLCTCYSLYFVVIVRRLRGPGAGLRTIPASQNLLTEPPPDLPGRLKRTASRCWQCPPMEVAIRPCHRKPGT